MVRHVSLLRWRQGVTDDQIRAVAEGLAALPDQIPEVRSYRFGPDAGLSAGNEDFAVVADFEDHAAYRRYAEHPAHRRVIADLLSPILESRHAVQFEM